MRKSEPKQEGASVHTRRTFPIDYVNQFPGILVQLDLQLPVLVNSQLCQGIQHATALASVLFVYVKFTGRQVEGR
jgi:hypothetical protein